MLELDQLCVTIEGRSILKQLSLVVEEGTCVTITGANGSGKSTLFECLVKRRRLDSGSIVFQGRNLQEYSQAELAQSIAQLRQDPKMGSVGEMTVRENLALASLRGKRAGLRKAKAITTFVHELGIDMERWLHLKMNALSGGQRQLVNLIMAILTPCKLLLLDEPTAALDGVASETLIKAVQTYIRKEGVTTLIITHHPLNVETFSLRLEEGRLTKENLLDAPKEGSPYALLL